MFPASRTPLVACALLTACGPESATRPSEAPAYSFTDSFASRTDAEWSEPVNLGPIVNSSSRDINAALSPDGLSLYFVSNRPGGFGNNDIWVSRRADRHSPWQSPANLGATVNSPSDDGGASLSDDGLILFFNSNRPGGLGAADIYMALRHDSDDDSGWEPPVNLGPFVNTASGERGPDYFGRGMGRRATLYFNRGDLAAQGSDLYAAPIDRDGHPTAAAELLEVSAPGANDAGQSVRSNGRAMYFWSNRAGTLGPADIWVATRHSPHDSWSTPENLGAPVNTAFAEERPHLSRDGRTLLFDSDRPGAVGGQGQDLWMSTRRLSGRFGR